MTVPEVVALAVTALTGGSVLGGLGVWIWKGGSKWQALDGRLGGIEREVGRVADEIHELREDRELLAVTASRVDDHQRRLDRIAP